MVIVMNIILWILEVKYGIILGVAGQGRAAMI